MTYYFSSPTFKAYICGDQQCFSNAYIKGVVSSISLEYLHTHMAKMTNVCKSCVRRLKLNMNVIGLRVFPL